MENINPVNPNNPILKDADRVKLDGIVQQMIKNGESDKNIQTVVSDFKNKYAVTPQNTVKKKENTVSPSASENGKSSSVSKDAVKNNAFANRVLDYHKTAPTNVPQVRTNVNGKKIVDANPATERVHHDPITGNQRVVSKDVQRFDAKQREKTYTDAKLEANAPLEYNDILNSDSFKEKTNYSMTALQAYVAQNNIPITAPEDWNKARELMVGEKVNRIATKQTTAEVNSKRITDFLSKQDNPFSGDPIENQNQIQEKIAINNPIIRQMNIKYSDKIKGIDNVEFDLFTKEVGLYDQFGKQSTLNQKSSYQTEEDAVGVIHQYMAWKNEKSIRDLAIIRARQMQMAKKNPEEVDKELYQATVNEYNRIGNELRSTSDYIKDNIIPKFEKYTEAQKEHKQKHQDYAQGKLGTVLKVTAENTWNKVNETLLGITNSAIRLVGDGANIITEGAYDKQINSFFDGFVDILTNGSHSIAADTVQQNVIDNYKTYHLNGKTFTERQDGYIYDDKNNIVNPSEYDFSKATVTDQKEFNPIGIVAEGINQFGLVSLSAGSGTLAPYFLVSYENNRAQYQDAFPDSTTDEAIMYATALSSVELLSEKIMPDSKYFEMGWGKSIVNALKGVDKASRKDAIKVALKNYVKAIALENAEEFIPTLAQFGMNNAINTIKQKDGALKDDITSDEILTTLAVTTAFSGLLAGRNARYDYKSMRNGMSLNDVVILNSNNEKVRSEISNMLENEDVVAMIGAENIQEFQRKSLEFEQYKNRLPENTKYEQFEKVKDLLDEKEQLSEKRKNLDDNFVEPIDARIKEIDEKIQEVYQLKPKEETKSEEVVSEEKPAEEKLEKLKPLESNKTNEPKTPIIAENQTDLEAKRKAEINAIPLVPLDNKVKVKEREAKIKEINDKYDDLISKNNTPATENTTETKVEQATRHERTSLIIEEAKAGKTNISEDIAEQTQILESIEKKSGKESEQYKTQQKIVNELNDYHNNAMFDNGQYQMRIEDGVPVVTSKTGKVVNENAKRAVVKEAIAAGKFSQAERVLNQDGLQFENESQVINYVAENSQNPSEIAEMIVEQQKIDDANSQIDPIEKAIAEKVRNRGVKKSSFIENSDKNQITKPIESSYLSNNGRSLDQIAMEVEMEIYGDYNASQPRITEQNIVDFILANPSSKDYFSTRESAEIQKLKENFAKYSGIPATTDNLSLFTENQNQSTENDVSPISDHQMTEEELAFVFDNFENDNFHQDIYNEDSLPFQKGKQNFRKISQKAFDAIITQLQKAFGGNINIITDPAAFKAKMQEFNQQAEFMRTKDGNIFGAAFPDGTIYLDQNNLNANTPIHEFGHIWANLAKQQNPEVYNQAIEVVMQDEVAMNEVRNDPAYAHLTTDEQIANEVLAQQIGNIGEAKYWEQKDAGLGSRIKTAINNLLDYVKSIFGKENPTVNQWTAEQFQKATLQDLAASVSADLMSGKQLFDGTNNATNNDVQLSAQGYGPGTTVNLNPNNTSVIEPSKLMPEKLHKRATEIMRDGLKKRKKTSEVIKDGIEYLEKQDWYQNLSQEEKAFLDSNLITYMKKGFEKTPKKKSRSDIEAEVNRHRAKGLTDDMILGKFKNNRDQRIAKDILARAAAQNKTNEDIAKNVRNVFDTARERQKAKVNIPKFLARIKTGLLEGFLDNQNQVNNLVKKAGLDLVRNYIHAARGASSVAKEFYDAKAKQIYKGFSNKDMKTFNDIVMAKRIIQIDKDRAAKGLDPVIHSGNISGHEAQIFLDSLQNEIGSEKFKMFEDRAKQYFDANREVLKKLKTEGIISQELYDNLKDLDYQRREYIDFMKDEEGHYLEQNPRGSKNAKEPILKLEDGSDAFLIMESDYLLQRTISIAENAIARNNMTLSLVTEMGKQKQHIEQLKAKDPKDLTKAEKQEIKYFEQLEKNVKFDKKEAGRGFVEIKYKENGEEKSFFMEQQFADKFREIHVAQKLSGALGTILKLPSSVTKTIATGNNPSFFLVNTPIDIMNVAVLSEEYSWFVPLNLLQVTAGAGINATKMLVNRGAKMIGKDYKHDVLDKYIMYGGGMDFMNREGDIRKTAAYDMMMNLVDRRAKNTMNGVLGFLKMQAIQDASEMGVRLAVFDKAVQNRFKAENVKNEAEFKAKYASEGEYAVNRRLRDLYTSAVHAGRSTADFAQKGTNYDVMEAIIPYFNAAMQSKRFLFNAMQDRPKETTFRLLQGAAVATGVFVGGSLAAIAKLRPSDDEEDKDLSTVQLYIKMLNGVSEHDKAGYNIFFTGRKTESGEYEYYRVAKSQDLTPFHSLVDNAILAALKHSVGDESETPIFKSTWGAISKNILPLEISVGSGNLVDDAFKTAVTNGTKNPFLKSIITYQTGYDFFRDQPLSHQNGKVAKELEGYEMKNMDEFYKELGKDLDVSPARLKGAVESIITTPATSPWVGLAYGGADYIFAEEKTQDKKMIQDYFLKSFKGRVVKETSEFNRNLSMQEKLQERKSEMLKNNREDIERKQAVKSLAEQINAKEITLTDAIKEIKSFSYDSEVNKTKDLPRRINQLKERIQNKGVSQIVFDVKYELNKENRAVLLQEYFGAELIKKQNDKYVLKSPSEMSEEFRELYKQMRVMKAIDAETQAIYLESFNK